MLLLHRSGIPCLISPHHHHHPSSSRSSASGFSKYPVSFQPSIITMSRRRYLVLITGASRGYGKCLASEAARTWSSSNAALDMHLIARNASELEKTKESVLSSLTSSSSSLSSHGKETRIWTWPVDLGDLGTLQGKLDSIFQEIAKGRYEKAYLFNNAGSVGPIAFAQDLTNLEDIRKTIDTNVTSFLYLTSLFMRIAGGASRPDQPQQHPPPSSSSTTRIEGGIVSEEVSLINISSLAAIQPFQSWGLYCAGKATRDMFTSVIAKEQEGNPKIKTLNYAPGPMDTDMQTELRENESTYLPHKEWGQQAFDEGKLVRPEASAAKCLRLLQENTYTSGAHMDYYDV